jgi:hypothetical protein
MNCAALRADNVLLWETCWSTRRTSSTLEPLAAASLSASCISSAKPAREWLAEKGAAPAIWRARSWLVY